MLKNYVTVALRALFANSGYTAVNVLGLGLSSAIGLLVILFVQGQSRSDDFHALSDQTYRVTTDLRQENRSDAAAFATAPLPLAAMAVERVPGVEAAVAIRNGLTVGTGVGMTDGALASGIYAGPQFFDVFSFELAAGDPATALSTPGQVVLSAQAARDFFGDLSPVGRTVTSRDDERLVVSGVLRDVPYATHLPHEAIASLPSVLGGPPPASMWTEGLMASYVYLVLAKAAAPNTVASDLEALATQAFPPRPAYQIEGLELQALGDINLGRALESPLGLVIPAMIVYFLAGLAAVLLAVSATNYAGLAVARGLARRREVGVRKALGARRWEIAAQFLVEALLVTLLSMMAAGVLMVWLAPAFNASLFVSTTGTQITPEVLWDWRTYAAVLGFVGVVAAVAGLYPAWSISSVEPALAVKSRASDGRLRGLLVRKGLTVSQFALSLVLVITTGMVWRQSAYLLETDYGFETTDALSVALQDVDFDRADRVLATVPGVVSVAGTSRMPGTDGRMNAWLQVPGAPDRVEAHDFAVTADFPDALGLEVIAGTGLDMARPAGVLLNQTAVRALDLEADPVGRQVVLDDTTAATVVGVVRDYQANVAALGEAPVVLTLSPERIQWALVRTAGPADDALVGAVEARWSELSVRPLRSQSVTSMLASSSDKTALRELMRIVGFVAGLTLLIATLGLLALAAYTVQRRTREVAIRKAMGARSSDIVATLSREFAVLLSAAVAVAVPLAWLLNSAWLELFERRVALTPAPFLAAVLLVGVLAAVAVGSQALRADRQDPVRALHQD